MFKKTLLVLSLFILLTACAGAKLDTSESIPFDSGYTDYNEMEKNGSIPEEALRIDYDHYSGSSIDTSSITERLVIKNANLTIIVDEPEKASLNIGEMAEEIGGYTVSANLYQIHTAGGIDVPQASITIRVPAEQLNKALAFIKEQSKKDVINENISSQDVTGEYTDLQSRLRNAEAAEAELTNIMEEATKTEDVLNVYAQLKAVREEVELLKGQIQYYEQSAAYSLISVELLANEAVQPVSIAGWEPQGIARDAIQALINVLQLFGSAAIWAIFFCAPVLLILGIPLALVIGAVNLLVRKARKGTKEELDKPSVTDD